MATFSRVLPQSSIGFQNALTTAKTKKDGVAVPADNILSATTSTRLDTDYTAFEAAKLVIASKQGLYHAAVAAARPQRVLLKGSVTDYFNRMSHFIEKGMMHAADRAYYGLDITNQRLPVMNTDVKLLAIAAKVLSGDILRVDAGGMAMDEPTIAAFTLVLNAAKPIINAISNAHTALNTAKDSLEHQTPEIKDLITHIWDEVEAYYSMSKPVTKRQQARLWGVRYKSVGVASTITGVCTDSITHAPLANVKLHLVGVGKNVVSDASGNFTLNTKLFEDLSILAKLTGYEDCTLDFFKEDGVTIAVSVVMVKKVI